MTKRTATETPDPGKPPTVEATVRACPDAAPSAPVKAKRARPPHVEARRTLERAEAECVKFKARVERLKAELTKAENQHSTAVTMARRAEQAYQQARQALGLGR